MTVENFTARRFSGGRFDYSLADGRPQIWEINTRGVAVNFDRLSIELHRAPMRRIATALLALDGVREQTPELAVSS